MVEFINISHLQAISRDAVAGGAANPYLPLGITASTGMIHRHFRRLGHRTGRTDQATLAGGYSETPICWQTNR